MLKLILAFALLLTYGTYGCQVVYNRNFRWSSCPTYYMYPQNESEIIDIINVARSEGAVVRALGGGISWNSVGMVPAINYSTGMNVTSYMLNLTAMSGIFVDNDTMTVRIQPGARVLEVCQELEKYDLGLKDFGGPVLALFMGSAFTGTHGKGSAKNPIATMAGQIIALRMVTSNGSIVIANNTFNPDILSAVTIGLGGFGVVTEVTVQASPIFYVTRDKYVIENMTDTASVINAVQTIIINLTNNNDYIYGGLQTFGEHFQFQIMNITDKNETNRTCWNDDETGYNSFPCTDVYYKSITPPIYSEIIHGRNQESEFYVREMVWVDAWIEMLSWALSHKYDDLWNQSKSFYDATGGQGELQLNIRWIGKESLWLSPSYNDTMVQIGLYIPGNFTTRVPDPIFDEWTSTYFEHLASFSEYAPVRVHFGKESLVGYCDINGSYPKMSNWIQLRNQLDPTEMFLNDFIRDKLGLCAHETCCDICCCTGTSCGFEANSTTTSTNSPTTSTTKKKNNTIRINPSSPLLYILFSIFIGIWNIL